MTTPSPTQPSELARQLHEWYLEATKTLKPESYNPNAQKTYDDMTDEQKFIDQYIAEKVTGLIQAEVLAGKIEEVQRMPHEHDPELEWHRLTDEYIDCHCYKGMRLVTLRADQAGGQEGEK